MSSRFASSKHAIGICDRCGFQYPLDQLKTIVRKTKPVNILVCAECWEPDQPQLQVGMYPVEDPQALRNPRPDNSYTQAGDNASGAPSMGSRVYQWGWNPVGGARNNGLTENDLVANGEVGTVTII